jgi:N-acyl-L-homoserine lactone synthetase
VTQELFCGLIEFCLERDIRQVVTVYDIRIARLLPRVGCWPIWRTRAQRIGNTSALAGLFSTDRATLDEIRRRAGISGSVIAAAMRAVGPRAA